MAKKTTRKSGLPQYVLDEQRRQQAVLRAKQHQKSLRGRYKLDWAKLAKKLPKYQKSDIGKIFFAALPTKSEKAKGKKFILQKISGRRKSFSFFVNRKLKPRAIMDNGAPQYARPQTVKVIATTPKYVIKKSYAPKFSSLFSMRDVETGKITERYPCINGKNITWDRITSTVTEQLRYFMTKKFKNADINFVVKMREVITASVTDAKDVTSYNDYLGVEFKSRALQKFGQGKLENYVSKMLYAHFAEQLAKNEKVTVGSAAYIQRRFNRDDEDRSEWTTDDGSLWDKRDWDDVVITHFCYDIESLRI